MAQNNNYFILLDRDIKNAKALPPLARLIYGDICTLSKSSGECYASNKYLAKEYEVSAKTVSRHIAALKKAKLIKTCTRRTEFGNLQRYIAPFLPVDTPKVSNGAGQKRASPPDNIGKHNIEKKNMKNKSLTKEEIDILNY